jgi:site-specific DNA recombinase
MSERRVRAGARCAIYTRVSHREQETIGEQERRARAFADSKGWQVVQVFSDRGISAWSGADRPQWLALEAAVDRQQVDAVVVFQVSRAARNTVRLGRFIELCKDRDVVFASCSEGVDTSTAMGRLMATIIGALAELESEIRSERTLLGLERVRAEGRWTGGREPYGFRAPTKRERESGVGQLVPVPGEQERIREAASRLLAGQGLATIARDFNGRRIRTKRGGRWSATALRDVLSHDRHAGTTMTHRDWERIASKLAAQSEAMPHGARYMLTGILRCSVCGEPLRAQPARGVNRYRCFNSHGVVIAADEVEEYVSRLASEHESEEQGVADPSAAPAEIAQRLTVAEERLRDAARQASEGGVEPGALRAYLERFTRERDEIAAELEAAAPRKGYGLAELIEDPDEEATPEEQRGWVEEVVDHVTVYPRGHAPRLEITWR